jgi:Holliday junction resolvase RusA-like endonuclease
MQGGKVHSFTPAQTAAYEALVAATYRSSFPGMEAACGAVQVAIRAFYDIPKSWTKEKRKKAAAGMIPATVKPDADNILKVIADALNGIAWQDDKQIIYATVEKLYGVPRVEVEIWRV